MKSSDSVVESAYVPLSSLGQVCHQSEWTADYHSIKQSPQISVS